MKQDVNYGVLAAALREHLNKKRGLPVLNNIHLTRVWLYYCLMLQLKSSKLVETIVFKQDI